jgi:hypothetical protein
MRQSRHRRRRPFVPSLERLESRDQPTAVVTQTGGLLTINDQAATDVIRIGDDGMGNIAVLSGQLTSPQLFHDVTAINVQTFTGADSVHYDLLAPLNSTRSVRVSGTGSKDVQFYTNNNPLLPDANLFLSAQVGGGGMHDLLAASGADPNQATVNRFTAALGLTLFTPFQLGILRYPPRSAPIIGSDVPLNARLAINLNGGSGSNAIAVAYQGIVQGALSVTEQGAGGPKRDAVTGLLQLFGGTSGTVNAAVGVSPGRDNIMLEILEVLNNQGIGTQFTPTINGLLNGGPQQSVTRHTLNVQVMNSSSDTRISNFG